MTTLLEKLESLLEKTAESGTTESTVAARVTNRAFLEEIDLIKHAGIFGAIGSAVRKGMSSGAAKKAAGAAKKGWSGKPGFTYGKSIQSNLARPASTSLPKRHMTRSRNFWDTAKAKPGPFDKNR